MNNYITKKDELVEKPIWLIFIIVWVFYLTGRFMFFHFVWDTNTLIADYKGSNIDNFVLTIRRVDMLMYALSPIWIISITAAIWLSIKTGLIILNTEFDGRLLFKIVLLGTIFLSLPFWIKSIWLILIEGNYTPDDVKYFFPGSIVSFIDTSKMNIGLVTVLSRFNLFHLAFILFTAWMISIHSELKYIRSIGLIFSTYGFGFILLQGLMYVVSV